MSITSVVNDLVTSVSVINALKPLPPTISGYSVGGLDDTALDPAGGQTVQINGTGFLAGATITFDGSAVAVVTYVNPNQLTFTSPAKTAGTYTIYAVNPDGGTAIYIPGIIYSVLPTWTTSAGTLGSYYETTNISNTVVASGDAPITYSLFSGSLPTGSTLYANGVITGTAPVDSSSTTYSFTIQATDAQLQDSTRSFSLTINVDAVTWVSPANATTYTSAVDSAIATVTLNATDAAGYAVSYSANALPTGLSLSGANIAGTPTVIADSSTLLTATAATTNRTATRTINWSITVANDVYFEYNTLLIPGASTTFVDDASTNNFAVTINGDTKPNNFNPYTPGYYSNYFDGTGDYLTCVGSGALVRTSGSFTIEGWYYPTSASASYRAVYSSGSGYATAGRLYQYGTQLEFYNSSSGSAAVGSIGWTINTWNHFAVTWDGTTTKIYVNGQLSNTNSFAYSGTTDLSVSEATYTALGYVSNFRVVSSVVYTAAFTPSTSPLTAISGTQLLTCQSNRFIDTSTNALTIAVNGNTSISSFDPFVPNSSYSSYGSGYFDGTGDYLSVASSTPNQFGSGDFTLESWYYCSGSISTSGQQLFFRRTTAAAIGMIFQVDTSKLQIIAGDSNSGSWEVNIVSSTTLVANTWYHFAASRSGSTWRIFINGAVEGTATASFTIAEETGPITIGSSITGYLSDWRAVKGTAVYTTTFTPPSAPLTAIANTSLLVLQNNQSVNNSVFLDNSTNNFLVTRNGNTTQGTFSPYGPNWSNYFDGTGDYLQTPSSSSLGFGTSNFTMEMWVYSGANGTGTRCGGNGTGGSWSSGNWVLATSTPGNVNKFCLGVNNTSSDLLASISTFNNSQWMHVAITRSGSSWAMFVNGVRESTATSSVSLDNGGSKLINLGGSNLAGDSLWTGYISNFRVVIGTAVYSPSSTTITVPTTPLTPITNTQLLTCQSNRLIDNSINNFTITKAGDTSVQRFSPFNPASVTPTSYSGYFDGTGDYLTVPSNSAFAMGTGDFTIECWVNTPLVHAYNDVIIELRSTESTSTGFVFNMNPTGIGYQLNFYTNGGFNLGSTVLNYNVWNHCAVTRSGTTVRLFSNGVLNGTFTKANNFSDTPVPHIGVSPLYGPSDVIGYFSNLRVIKGTALYTTTFTPSTTPLTTTSQGATASQVSLLTCQSPTFIDNSTNNFTITAVGNSQPTIQNPFGYTSATTNGYTVSTIGGSGYFDGSGDYLTAPSDAAYQFGTGDFTIEYWIYQTTSGIYRTVLDTRSSGTASPWACLINSSNQPYILITSDLFSSIAITINAWNHVAIVRSGTNLSIYVNGVIGLSTTNSTSISPTGSLRVGLTVDNVYPMLGYLTDIRIIKGTAVYKSNFVPPSAPLTAVQNTTLLNNMTSAGVYDAAMMTTMETVGDAKLSTAVSKFGGSSMSFDGTGDWLFLPANTTLALGSGDFTVEMWMYPNLTYASTYAGLLDSRTNADGAGLVYFGYTGTANQIGWKDNTTNVVTGTVTQSTWNHVAVVRSSGTMKLYINGTSVSTGSNSTNYTVPFKYIATSFDPFSFNGYIDDLRITKGLARYTTNFTAPTSAFPIY